MLLHKSVVHDSRVRREAKALASAGHDVTVAHLAPGDVPAAVRAEGYRVVSALSARLGRRRLPLALHRLVFMWNFVRVVRAVRPDVVHAHDAAMLAPGWLGARLAGARLVYDSHELATGVAYRGRVWARFVWLLERLVVRRCAAVLTVSDGIAERLQGLYGLPKRPLVVRNLPDLPRPDSRIDVRKQLGIAPDAPLVLHHGAAAPGRGCERLVSAAKDLPSSHVLFLGDHDAGWEEHLKRLAEDLGVSDRVHLVGSVPLDVLLGYTAEADVGVSLLEDSCENHRLALPNKVFEYAAAGLPVVATALPELEKMIRAYGLGWTVPSHDSVALSEALAAALRESREGVIRAHIETASRELAWPREAAVLTQAYEELEDALLVAGRRAAAA